MQMACDATHRTVLTLGQHTHTHSHTGEPLVTLF